MEQSIVIINNMDCPTEEALIRKRLGSVMGVAELAFNLETAVERLAECDPLGTGQGATVVGAGIEKKLDGVTYHVLHSAPMSRAVVYLLIFFVTVMHIAWANDICPFSGTGDTRDSACMTSGDCDQGEAHQTAVDPSDPMILSNCSHGCAHLVGILSGSPQHSLPESAATPVTATIYFSVLSSPPTTPPKA